MHPDEQVDAEVRDALAHPLSPASGTLPPCAMTGCFVEVLSGHIAMLKTQSQSPSGAIMASRARAAICRHSIRMHCATTANLGGGRSL